MTNDKNPVVLVHGLWNTVNIFWRLRNYLEAQGWCVYAVNLMPNNGDASIEQLAQQTSDFILNALGEHQPFDLVGFSMGGLVSRYYLQKLGGVNRVTRFVSIATPHYGSTMAWFRWNSGGVQMQPGSRFLRDLNRDISQLRHIHLTSLWTPLDLLVVPAVSGRLPVGHSQRIWVSSHNNMLKHPQSLKAIEMALSVPANRKADKLTFGDKGDFT